MSQLDRRALAPAAPAVGLTKSYETGDGVVYALDGVDVEFERGRFTALMGPSGSGKPTPMHELGLLRAVGMKRQVRAMIRLEAEIIALFRAVIAVIIGTGLGVAFASSLKQEGLTEITLFYASLIGLLILGALLGPIAARWRARRVAKLDALAAIATQ